MKIKTQLTLASVIAAGLLASGCSQQMVAQQAVPAEPEVKTVLDCSSCNKPMAPAPKPMKPMKPMGGHTHPAIPGCTDSIRHNHPHPQGARHTHKYSCKKAAPAPMRPRPAPMRPRPAPMAPAPVVNPDAHTHPAIPNCTNSIRHVHPNGRRAHQHRYSCRRPAAPAPQPRPPVYRPPAPQKPMMPVVPQVKAKGNYRGPIQIDGVMQQYQQ